jgi:hypothetical protein
MPFRDNQGVAAVPGADVEKGHSPIVLINPSGGQFPRNDLAKNAMRVDGMGLRRLRGVI